MLYCCTSRTSQSSLSLVAEKPASFQVTPQNLARRVFLSCLSVLALALAFQSEAQLPSQDFFPIGVHAQPTSNFAKWKSRGLNTMFQYEGQNNSQGVPAVTMKQTLGFGRAASART